MAKKIIVLSDGTGNAASSVWRTNVWRIFESLDLSGNDQAAKYDDGVGTSSFKPLAMFGGAFGWGLKRNVIDCYKFICRNYEPDSQLFFFGFSRGAFTVRVINALILNQGLVKGRTESELHAGATRAYRVYRASRYKSILRLEAPLRKARDLVVSAYDKVRGVKPYDPRDNITVPSIEFVGLWDTVAAYGLPVDEMTRGISDWIWPLELPDRTLSSKVRFARHAVALDDERTTFHPVLWTEKDEVKHADADGKRWIKDERISQVWFAGMHSNVGGGYPDDALAFVPLQWIFDEAKRCGLRFKSEPSADPDTTKQIASSHDKDGRMYNSRSGLGSYYRYGPRDIAALIHDRPLGTTDMLVEIDTPKIHHSVFGRIDSGRNAYAPIGLPKRYDVVDQAGQIRSAVDFGIEQTDQANRRMPAQDLIWNLVWMRRVTYFLTVAASFYLVVVLLLRSSSPQHEFASSIRWVSEILRSLQSILPGAFNWWFNAWARQPEHFLATFAIIIGLIWLNLNIGSRIQDAMHIVWTTRGEESPIKRSAFHSGVTALRTNRLYRGLIQTVKHYLAPFAFAVATVWLGFGVFSHVLFNVLDSRGAYCSGSAKETIRPVNLGIEQPANVTFKTSDFCFATGLRVRTGYKYEITVRDMTGWRDGDVPAAAKGYPFKGQSLSQQIYMIATYPLRRVLMRSNFNLIARVGAKGNDEYFLDLYRFKDQPGGAVVANAYRDTFKAQRDGEVFLYVNDAALALPWLTRMLYADNTGTATVSLKVID